MNVTTTLMAKCCPTCLLLTAMLLAAVALGGCTAEGLDSQTPASPRQAIAFGLAGSPATRTASGSLTLDGSGTGEQSLQAVGFGVFACHTGLHPYVSSAITSNFMWNQRVAYNTTASIWDYTPVRYWPDPIEGLSPYISFFAYAPYAANPGTGSTVADQCIVDLIHSVEGGDPWLVYQLGGSEDDWQDSQADLLYDFQRDQQQGEVPQRVSFNFRHALACAGDNITVTCSPELQSQLLQAYDEDDATPVTLSLQGLTLTYTLLRKGRLWLNSTDTPRWESIQSDVSTVVRRLTLQPEHTLASVTSASEIVLTDYTSTNQGIFYIPLVVSGISQYVDISVEYATSLGTSGTLSTRVDLSTAIEAGSNRSFRIALTEIVPDP